MGPVIGTDISFYQDEPSTPQGVNFNVMRSVADFVIVLAGQNTWTDSRFAYHWSESKKIGMPRGSYWFYDSRSDPKRQAELWAQTLANDLGELPLWADFEENYGGTFKGWENWYVFLERLRTLVGQKEIGIYTAYYYWRENAPNPDTQAASLAYFRRYPLWIAHYNVQKPRVPPPWGENEWVFWQYTDRGDGKRYGVESKQVDLNYFNGDLEAFKARFNLNQPQPPLTSQFRVDLSVREGPAATFNALATLDQNDLVEHLTVSEDGDWTQIKREKDELIGWVNNTIFVPIPVAPPEDPEPPTDPEPPIDPEPPDVGTGRMYRVTASALRVRSGPGTNFGVIGGLLFNAVVEELTTNEDKTWMEIRTQDGFVGWCAAQYLDLISQPPSPPPVSEFPWYRVTATSLFVREGPGTNFQAVGGLFRDDVVLGIGPATNGWVQITRYDGLTGFSSLSHLANLGTTQPKSIRQRLFLGATYFRREYSNPRLMVAHIFALDLQAAKYSFFVTPESQSGGISCTRTTSQFLSEFQQQIAINGDGFTYLPTGTVTCAFGDPVRVNGFAASTGKVYNTKSAPTLFANPNHEVTLETPKGNIHSAISGDRIVLRAGKRVTDLAVGVPEPRTAVGLTQNGRGLLLMVVDGRQPTYSQGATLHELVDILLAFGAYSGINMDGGGSSSLVIRGTDNKPRILNRPIDSNIPGQERAVANHFGITIKT
ncbi:MAG: phosphodiester glycosidase family protein [Anaerolineales bacterium]